MAFSGFKKDLPEDIKAGILDQKNFKKICKIAEIFGFEKKPFWIDALDGIFEKTMEGEISLNKVPQEIENQLNISKESANKISNSLYSEIFSNYKESLSKFYPKEKSTPLPPQPPQKEKEKAEIKKAEEKASIEFPQLKVDTKKDSLEKEILKESTKKDSENLPKYKPEEKREDEVSSILKDLSKELDKAKSEEDEFGKKNEEEKN